MRRIATTNRLPNLHGAGKDGFKDGDLAVGIKATEFSAEFANGVQEELMSVVESGGLAPAADSSQVQQAIRRLAGANVTVVTAALSPFTLTADHAGLVLVNAAAGDVVLDLPLANAVAGVPVPFEFARRDNTGNAVTINAAGTNLIDGAASFALTGRWTSRSIRSDASTAWLTTGNTALRTELAAPTGAALVGGGGQVVNSITALRALLKTSPSSNAFVTGYYAPGDGGGGPYVLDAADVASVDNGGTVIVASDGGCWKLAVTCVISVKQFGAVGDGVIDDTVECQAAMNTLGTMGIFTVRFPNGSYKITSSLSVGSNHSHVLLDHNATIKHDTPDFMALRFSGANGLVSGGKAGGFVGPAAWDAGNGATIPSYGVIAFSGEGGEVRETRLFNIRRIGVWFKDVNSGSINGNIIDGQQPKPVYPLIQTLHFGAHFDAGTEGSLGNFKFQNNIVRKCTTGFFTGNYGSGPANTRSVISSGNTYEDMWDHGEYSAATGGFIVNGNTYHRCHIPVAATGYGNLISNITLYTEEMASPDARDIASAVSLRDPVNCVVNGVTIVGHGDIVGSQDVVGVDCINVTNTPMNGNIIANITMRLLSGKARAVRMSSSTAYHGNTIKDIIFEGGIRDNNGAVQLEGAVGSGNDVDNINVRVTSGINVNAVYAGRQAHSLISRVKMRVAANAAAATNYTAVALLDCNDTKVRDTTPNCEVGFGTNITLYGVREFDAAIRNEVAGIKEMAGGLAVFVPIFPLSAASKMLIDIAGSAAPTFPARAGSRYARHGGAMSSSYVCEADGNFWVAK